MRYLNRYEKLLTSYRVYKYSYLLLIKKFTSKQWKWIRNIFLLFIISLGIIISIKSSKFFIAWFGLELKMFGIIPFLILNSNLEEKKKELKVAIYYFIIQVLGRMLFSWGRIIGNRRVLGLIGLLIKMGVSPFFWWVPSILRRVDWISLLVLRTIQKIPSIILIRISFDLSFNSSLYICLSGLIISIVGINFSSKNFKVLFAWSSVGNMSLLLLLLTLFLKLGIYFFILYMLSVTGVIVYILNTKENLVTKKKKKKNRVKNFIIISLFILIFSGIPPLLGFITKILFFRGISLSERDLMIKQVKIMKYKIYMIDYPKFKVLGRWKLNIIIRIILIFQVVAYIKIFIKVYTSSLVNLEGRRRNLDYKIDLNNYLLMAVLISIIPLLIL